MHVAHREPPLVKQVPLTPMRFDRVHAHADEQMPWTARQEIETLALNCLAPANRVVISIKKTDVSLLVQDKKADED